MEPARWIGACPACGDVEVVVRDAALRIDPDRTSVEFTCPSSQALRMQSVDGPTGELFQALDAEVRVSAPAEEPAEPAS